MIKRIIFDAKDTILCEPDKAKQYLEILYKEYELVLLTEERDENQEIKVNVLEMDSFFTEKLYLSSDNTKSNKKDIEMAIGSHFAYECVFIGTDYECEILPSLQLGIKTILLDKENKYHNPDCFKVESFEEVVKM